MQYYSELNHLQWFAPFRSNAQARCVWFATKASTSNRNGKFNKCGIRTRPSFRLVLPDKINGWAIKFGAVYKCTSLHRAGVASPIRFLFINENKFIAINHITRTKAAETAACAGGATETSAGGDISRFYCFLSKLLFFRPIKNKLSKSIMRLSWALISEATSLNHFPFQQHLCEPRKMSIFPVLPFSLSRWRDYRLCISRMKIHSFVD